MDESKKMEEKESFGTKTKKFVMRNRKKFIIFGSILGGTLLGGGILKKHMQDDNGYIEAVEEDYESVEYTGDSDETTEENETPEEQ